MRFIKIILCQIVIILTTNSEEQHKLVSYLQFIDTFTICTVDDKPIPCGWYSSQKRVDMFTLKEECGNWFVNVKTSGGNTSIGIKYNFDPKLYPVLQWKWRIHTIPRKGKENEKRYSDSAAGVYVIFRGKFKLNRIIKYVWSSSLAAGMIVESPFNRQAFIKVLHCGSENTGKWIEEKVNVCEDFECIFGVSPPEIEGIAILSDSDNTQSSVEADYDDFRLSVIK